MSAKLGHYFVFYCYQTNGGKHWLMSYDNIHPISTDTEAENTVETLRAPYRKKLDIVEAPNKLAAQQIYIRRHNLTVNKRTGEVLL